MYRINYTGRPVLITPDEVLFHSATDHSLDPRQIIQNIIVAEERWIAPALGNDLYADFISKKNLRITQANQAATLATINASLTAAGKPTITNASIPVGTWINAIEYVTPVEYVELWEMYLWKLTAEAVDLTCIVPSWLRHTSAGQQKNNPEVIGGSGGGSASGDRKDVQFKIDNFIQDRIDPLLERMHLWICKRRSDFSLYTRECECSDSGDGVSHQRKTGWVFGAYDDDTCDCADNLNFQNIDDAIIPE